jgi:hypothetical protein
VLFVRACIKKWAEKGVYNKKGDQVNVKSIEPKKRERGREKAH